MRAQNTSITHDNDEARGASRHVTNLPGKLFVPADEAEVDCTIINLSATGAGIQCSDPPPLEAFVVLYIERFGRYEAVSVRYADNVLGVRFLCTERKRARLQGLVNEYVQSGGLDLGRLRKGNQLRALSHLTAERPNGEKIRCDVIDVSLRGLSLRTRVHPPIDELLYIGRSVVRVASHHEQGIGVELLAVNPQMQDR
jgi:hypothetical protein